MFFKCPNCKRVWQYYLELCPECFLPLERMEEKKARVIGLCKVNIKTFFHPQTPYYVLLLEDENKNRWVYKSIKEYKIGEKFKLEEEGNKDSVAIWRIKYDIPFAISKVIELLKGLKIEKETKILILPTLVSATHSYLCENTTPQFLDALIEYLISKGALSKNIKIVGQSFDENPIELLVGKSGFLSVFQKWGVLPFDLSKGEFIKKEIEGKILEISKEVFDTDVFINLPILKVGEFSSVKNLLKLLKKENYLELKKELQDELIVEKLLKALPPFLTLGEGDSVQKSDGFIAFLGLVLASYSPFNLDRVFLKITKGGLTKGGEEIKIKDIPTVGRKIEEVQFDVEKYG
jgi:uncharacterized protein (DUF362 family)/uncharacterized OB-fold protein